MITEEMLRTAAARSSEIYTAKLEADYDPSVQHTFSPAFEKKIRKLKRRADHPVLYRTMQRVASFALALLIGGSALIAVNTEARAAFIGWIKEMYETYLVLRYEGPDHTATAMDYRLTWIPDGYTKFDSDKTEKFGYIVYSNDEGKMLKFVYAVSGTFFTEVEGAEERRVSVNGFDATMMIMTDGSKGSMITWTDESGTMLAISAYASAEDLIRLAESVQRSDDIAEKNSSYRPAWVPEEYSISRETDTGGSITVFYQNDEHQTLRVHYIYEPDAINIFVDAEDGNFKTVSVGDYSADLVLFDDPTVASDLVWIDRDNCVFCISAFLDEADMLRVANSIYEK